MRAIHFSCLDRTAESSITCITRDKTSHTPAWAWPARNSAHCVSSSTRPPGDIPAAPWLRIPSSVSPPYMIVGTVRIVKPETILASGDRFILDLHRTIRHDAQRSRVAALRCAERRGTGVDQRALLGVIVPEVLTIRTFSIREEGETVAR